MEITLEGEFDPAFLRTLPELELHLKQNSYDPADFKFSKTIHSHAQYGMSPTYDYEVRIGQDRFTIPLPDDMQFMAYIATLAFAPDALAVSSRNGPIQRRVSLLQRFSKASNRLSRWIMGEAFGGDKPDA